jgi:hypothetical protein
MNATQSLMATEVPSAPMRSEDSWTTAAVRTLIVAGAAWCGAVLSIAFGNSENVRWWSALAGAPMVTVVVLSVFAKPTPGRAKLMLALTAASGVVLLFSTGLVLGGFAPLSDGGRWKRALAAFSTVAIVLELRRLSRQPPPGEQPPKDKEGPQTPYLSVLTFGSFADLLSERATALGTTPAELVRRLEEAISVVAPLHFKTTARFEVAWQPVLQTFEVKAVVDGSGLPGGKPGDDAVFDVFWRVEDQTQARSQDAAYQATLGFMITGSGFDEVVEAVTRDVLGLPAAGPLDLLRDDWLRLTNAWTHRLRRSGTKYALELKTTSQALPQPVGGVHIYDAALEGPKLNDFRATPRALDTTIDVAGQPLHLGTQSWDALTVSVLGQPDLATLEAWTTRWMANADVAPEGQLAGVVHRVEVLRYATGCALTVDMGSAPVSALEELVVLLRPFGAVSLDEAALQSLAERRHEGGRDDLVPLVRTETGVFSEHLVGPLWVQYAVESKQVFTTVTPDELSGLGLDLASARALALENLRRRLPPAHFTGHLGVYMLTLPGEGGHFEASLLLLDEVWARAAPLVKGDVVAALPGRDLLLFTGTDDVEGLKKVRSVAADALEKGLEHPLTQQLIVRREGGWRVFDVLDAGPSNANLRGSYRTSSKSTV